MEAEFSVGGTSMWVAVAALGREGVFRGGGGLVPYLVAALFQTTKPLPRLITIFHAICNVISHTDTQSVL